MAQATLRWVIAIILVSLSLEQTHDPLNDFCRRFGHQTAVVDRRLYIDGGLVNWNSISQNSLNYSSMTSSFCIDPALIWL